MESSSDIQSRDIQKKDKQMEYTEEQKQFIYASKKRDIKVTACAGSGKTQCVLMYVKQAIEEGVDPSGICITTFNIQASNDMKKRAIEIMGNELADQIEITNIDKLITKLYDITEKNKEQKNNKKQVKNEEKENLKELSIDITLVEKQNQLYQNLLDLSLSQQIFDNYKLVIFDEFQDINQFQYDIFMLFKKFGKSILVVVGDDAQNIYEFRGSDYEFLRSKVVEDVNRENKIIYESDNYKMLDIKLTTNFRCSSKITAFSNDIIKSFVKIKQSQMQSYEGNFKKEKCKFLPTLKPHNSTNDLFESIKEQIIKFIQQKYRYEDIAIICPTGSLLREIEYRLEKHNRFSPKQQIPFWSFIGKNNDFDFKYEYKADKVTLLTIHKSKGLQWKVLFFVGLNDETFPQSFIKPDKNKESALEETRRLFYVGSTRAAEILNMNYFSCFNKNASRFLSRINENNIQLEDDVIIVQDTPQNLKSIGEQTEKYAKKGKQIDELFDEMSCQKYLEELYFSQKKFLLEKYFEQEKVDQIHDKMFSKQQIQSLFFNQSVELVFSYLEIMILRNLNFNTKIDQQSSIKNEVEVQISQIITNKKKLKIQDWFINQFKESIVQFLNPDLKIESDEMIESIYKFSVLYEISKSKNQIYKYLYQKNLFASLTKSKICKCLDTFVEYVKASESGEMLILDKIQYGKDSDPNRIFEYFCLSRDDTLYEIHKSFKKIKKLDKQLMLKILGKLSILKKKYGKQIKRVKIYNPINGAIFTFVLKDWEQHQEFIDFMVRFNEKI